MALSPYYGMFDPFSGLDPFAGLSDPFFSTVGFPTQTGGGGGRSRGVLDYPMVRMLGAPKYLHCVFPCSLSACCLPLQDVRETENSFEVYADAPGMKPEEVNVDFNDETRVLTIRGKHTDTSTETGSGATGAGHIYR